MWSWNLADWKPASVPEGATYTWPAPRTSSGGSSRARRAAFFLPRLEVEPQFAPRPDLIDISERGSALQARHQTPRGEYRRIIHGPGYLPERHLSLLRTRGLGHKRSLDLREYAPGMEALERLVAGEPLYRVHEYAFGVLTLGREPFDPGS